MVLGGSDNRRDVELYSPSGKCQHKLASMNHAGYEVVLSLVAGKILACGGDGNKMCWVYVVSTDGWATLGAEPNWHERHPGEAYQNRLYFASGNGYEKNFDILDPTNKTWSTWPEPPIQTGIGACLLAWRDTFLLIGGLFNKRGVQVTIIPTAFCDHFTKHLANFIIVNESKKLSSILVLLSS